MMGRWIPRVPNHDDGGRRRWVVHRLRRRLSSAVVAGSTSPRSASAILVSISVALAVGTVHTIMLCVLAVAAVLAWWGAEPMKARSAATLLLFTGIGLTAYMALQCVPMPIGWRTWCGDAQVVQSEGHDRPGA
jgi:hypothetical protein